MSRVGRVITWPIRFVQDRRYGPTYATCPYCLDRIHPARLDTHIYIDHASEQD